MLQHFQFNRDTFFGKRLVRRIPGEYVKLYALLCMYPVHRDTGLTDYGGGTRRVLLEVSYTAPFSGVKL